MSDNQTDFIKYIKERCINTGMKDDEAHEFAMNCWKLGFADYDATQFLVDENYKLYARTKLLERELMLISNALDKACECLEPLSRFSPNDSIIRTKEEWKQYFLFGKPYLKEQEL